MNCPICNVPLIPTTRLGSVVRLCPECCGEWVPQRVMDRLTGPSQPQQAAESITATAPQVMAEEPGNDLFNWF